MLDRKVDVILADWSWIYVPGLGYVGELRLLLIRHNEELDFQTRLE
jgi:hypothetical protein